MSTFVDLLPPTPNVVGEPDPIQGESQGPRSRRQGTWNPDSFAQEQISALARQVFCPPGLKAIRQVVFSAVDAETEVGPICVEIGLALSRQVSGTTCLVDASVNSVELKSFLDSNDLDVVSDRKDSSLRDPSLKFSSQLWFVPKPVLLEGEENEWSAERLRNRLADLRESFDYTVVSGPPAAMCSEAALLASLCDGMVLILRANSTRRVAAQKVKERLQSANVRLLGIVLSYRTFPIPEAIYRRV